VKPPPRCVQAGDSAVDKTSVAKRKCNLKMQSENAVKKQRKCNIFENKT
jgi:hypothetical protein